jgi:hypothetical protein
LLREDEIAGRTGRATFKDDREHRLRRNPKNHDVLRGAERLDCVTASLRVGLGEQDSKSPDSEK